jgi:hypothetical protein
VRHYWNVAVTLHLCYVSWVAALDFNSHERILNHTRRSDNVTGYVIFRKGSVPLYQYHTSLRWKTGNIKRKFSYITYIMNAIRKRPLSGF